MPKVKLNHKFESAKELTHTIDAAMAYMGMTQAELARRCGMSPTTFSRRKSNPQTFTLEEIGAVLKVTGINKDLVMEVMIG